jgi:hypothetical protein
MEVSGQLHVPDALHPGKGPGTHFVGGWVGLRIGLHTVGKRIISFLCKEPVVQPVASYYILGDKYCVIRAWLWIYGITVLFCFLILGRR